MYAQFFGAYLLNQGAVSPEQLTEAIRSLSEARLKLGTLAMHHGLMTASEVEEVCFLQTREDKKFGEIAVERGYLSVAQVEGLLETQTPDYLLLGQNLVDLNILDNATLEDLLIDYQNTTEIYTAEDESNQASDELIEKFFKYANYPITKPAATYLRLLFNNLIRFIGPDYTPLSPVLSEEVAIDFCVTQEMIGNSNFVASIDMSQDSAIDFASRYAKMDFTEFDEYVQASLEDFLNLHNGLFAVNMSNEYSVELDLAPPFVEQNTVIALPPVSYVIPVIYPFGTINLIITIMEEEEEIEDF
jgi:CheY-specific phosphatase CheX